MATVAPATPAPVRTYILVFSLKPGVKFLGKDLSLPEGFRLLAAPGITHDAISTDFIKHCREQLSLDPKRVVLVNFDLSSIYPALTAPASQFCLLAAEFVDLSCFM